MARSHTYAAIRPAAISTAHVACFVAGGSPLAQMYQHMAPAPAMATRACEGPIMGELLP